MTVSAFGQSRLYLGDCFDVMPTIDKQSVDLILCDLPYGTTQCKWDVVLPFDKIWQHYKRVIKPNGAIVLTSAQPFTSLLIASNIEMLRYDLIWEKGNATGFLNAENQPLRAHETICVFYERQPTFNPQMTHGHQRKTSNRHSVNSECYGKGLQNTSYDSTSRYPRSVNFFSSDKQKSNYHPTQKPVALMEYLIKTFTNEGDLVLDNCIGSGTTAVAAVNTNRRFIGIEKDKQYFDIANERVNSSMKQQRLLY